MRSRPDAAGVWSLLQCLLNARPLSRNGALSALLPTCHRRDRHCIIPRPFIRPVTQSFHGSTEENLQTHKSNFGGRNAGREMVGRGVAEGMWRDTLLSSPGALSTDSEIDRLYISDTQHHRIIIADTNGRVVDSIGSSPGCVDGTFEMAQLRSPASTALDASRNFLFIADSDNHAIRRADLGKRVLDTLHPSKVPDPELSLWERCLRWMGITGAKASGPEDEEGQFSEPLRHPWHLTFQRDGSLVAATDRFQSMWVLDSISGNVLEFQCQASELLFERFLEKAVDRQETVEGHPFLRLLEVDGISTKAGKLSESLPGCPRLVSRVSTLQGKFVYVDPEAQIVRDFEPNTFKVRLVRLSNLDLLGLPWWWTLTSPNLEFADPEGRTGQGSATQETVSHCHQVHIRPGRCLLSIDPVLPRGTALASRLGDRSVWRQARGSVVELSMLHGSLVSHSVSGAQQWLDDLDDLDSDDEEEEGEPTLPRPTQLGLPLYTLVDASLGSGEVTVDAVLYLRFRDEQDSGGLRHGNGGQVSLADRECQVFLKHLHVRVHIDVTATAPVERIHYVTVQM